VGISIELFSLINYNKILKKNKMKKENAARKNTKTSSKGFKQQYVK
jgi:hypothetical protein